MNRADTLDAARQCVLQDRNKTYGEPEDLYALVAQKWSATLGVDVHPAQVILCLIDLKTCRLAGNLTHGDSWVDTAGYAACGAEVAHAKQRATEQRPLTINDATGWGFHGDDDAA